MDTKILNSWKQGIDQFNRARYWHAHESWELGWKNLHNPEKEYIQALIQACAAFYLFIVKSRIRPGIALTRSALEKLQRTRSSSRLSETYPRIEIQGLQEVLSEIAALNPESTELKSLNWEKYTRRLHAKLFESDHSN
jgi:hypothetical protein